MYIFLFHFEWFIKHKKQREENTKGKTKTKKTFSVEEWNENLLNELRRKKKSDEDWNWKYYFCVVSLVLFGILIHRKPSNLSRNEIVQFTFSALVNVSMALLAAEMFSLLCSRWTAECRVIYRNAEGNFLIVLELCINFVVSDSLFIISEMSSRSRWDSFRWHFHDVVKFNRRLKKVCRVIADLRLLSELSNSTWIHPWISEVNWNLWTSLRLMTHLHANVSCR